MISWTLLDPNKVILQYAKTRNFVKNCVASYPKFCFYILSEFINGTDTDKANPYIEDCIARQEPLTKVMSHACKGFQ